MTTAPLRSRLLRVLHRTGLSISLLGGVYIFASQVDPHYPIGDWLFWSYLEYWLLGGVFTLACWSAGDAFVRRALSSLPLAERVVGSLAAGLLVFFLGMFFGGLFGLYGRWFFVALPLAMLVAGGRPFLRLLRRGSRHVAGAFRRWPPTPMGWIASLFGLVGLGMVYFLVLTPDNVSYDARWYHLPIAEHYVAQGAVRAFPEGWTPGALPHLASFVYTWAFLLPGGDLFDHVELSTHLEFVILLWTLASIPVLVRACLRPAWLAAPTQRGATRSVPRSSGFPTWAALFLFPGIFLYDSSLNGGADHVTAFWAVPAMLALMRFLRLPGPRAGLLLAVPLAGALLTKYQGLFIVAFPVVAVSVRVLLAWIPGRSSRLLRRDVALGALVLAFVGLLLTAPHWLKNWLWYGDPVYPFLHHHLALHPFSADAANLMEHLFERDRTWIPRGTTGQKLEEGLEVLATFSFRPHDWPYFHGVLPVFGSLFTLSVVPLCFLRRTARVWMIVAAAHLGVFLWFLTYHQDRYLQALVPWMAAVVAATLRLAWTSGLPSRLSASMLVFVQVAWGGDVYFFPTHGVLKASPVVSAIDLMSSGYRKRIKERREPFAPFSRIAKNLRRGSKVLVHDSHAHLGLGAMSVSDWGPWQGGISYGRLSSPRALYEKLRGYGVTHLLWKDNEGRDSFAGDLAFYAFVTRYARAAKSISGTWFAQMPSDPPPDTPWLDGPVAVFVCSVRYAPGQYRLGDLTVPAVGPQRFPSPRRLSAGGIDAADIVRTSDYAVLEPACHGEVPAPGTAGLRLVSTRGKIQLWVRP